jgi:hypothetical protein
VAVHGSRPTFAVELSLATDPFDAPSWTDETAFVRSFTMTRGRQQALDVFQPGTATVEVDNSDRRFDPNYSAGPHFGDLLPGRRGRIRATYGNTHLALPGVSTAYASTPDSSAYNVTDLDVRGDVALTDYTAAAEQTILSKWNDNGVNQRSWSFGVSATGALHLVQSANGTATVADVTSSATLGSVGVTDGSRVRVRATLDVNDGGGNRVVRFYYSTDLEARLDEATVWTQLGSTSTVAGVTTIFDSTAEVRVGTRTSATPLLAVGNFYSAALLSAIAGTALACPIFTSGRRFAANATTGTDLAERVWTIAGTADLVGAAFDVFGGFADGWPVPGLELSRSAVRFTDGFELLASAKLPDGSPMDVALRTLAPVHWYKLNEAQNSTEVADSGSTPTANGIAKGAGPSRLGAPGIVAGTEETAYRATAASPRGWIEVPDYQWTSATIVLNMATVGANPQTIWHGVSNLRYLAVDGTTSGFPGQFKAIADSTTVRSAARVDDGLTHIVTVVYDAGGPGIAIYIDGVLDAGAVGGSSPFGTYALATIAGGAVTPGDFGFIGTLSHLALFSTELTAGDALDLSQSQDAWAGDTIDARIDRLLDLSGWRASERNLDASAVGVLGTAEVGDDVLADARTLEASEGGAFYQEPDFTMRFRNRYAAAVESTSVVATFTDAPGADRFRFENPVIGAQGEWIRNRVKVSWQAGEIIVDDVASQATYGIREHSVDTVLGTALQAQGLAELILYRFAQPVLRVETIELNLAAEPIGWEAALGVEIGDRVRVVWTPSDVGSAIDFEALVDGKSITAGSAGSARATFSLADVGLEGLWIWDESLWDTSTVWG